MTVIELAIQVDDEALRADLEESPVDAPAAAVEQTYFVVPTRLSVDGTELLAFPDVHDRWRPLPLLGFAPQLRDLAIDLGDGEAATLSLADGGSLEFQRDGGKVQISSSTTRDQAVVPAEELVEAAVALAEDACASVLSIVPAMVTHGSWSAWCADRRRTVSGES